MEPKRRVGIILAAGLGKRLYDPGKNRTVKPLTPVDDLALLLRTIQGHEAACCYRVVIVLGWQAEAIEKQVRSQYQGPIKLVFIYNERYRLKNGLSLICARPFVKNEFILTMADHILDDAIMKLVSRHQPPSDGATLCVDYKLDTIFDMADATKVLTDANYIRAIGKELDNYNCVDTGVFIGTPVLIDAVDGVFRRTGDASLSDGVQILSEAGRMTALDIKDAFWQDVDTPEMLEHSEKLIRAHKMENLKKATHLKI